MKHRLAGVLLFTAAVALAVVRPASAQPATTPSAYWQLTFTYSADALQLIRVGRIPDMSKEPRSPGLEGAAVRLEYDLEWLDGAGLPLLTTQAVFPLGGHSVMVEGGTAHGADEHVPREGAFVVRAPGPASDAARSVRVRLHNPIGAAAGEPVIDPRVPPPFVQGPLTFELPARIVAATVGPISATKIRNTGADGNRFVIAILGDGFTADDLAAGRFSSKASTFLTALFATSPWNNYASMVNVYRVDIESAESGADYEDVAPEEGGTIRDTYLNAGYYVGGTDRCLFLRGDGVAKAMAAADELVGVGVWDEILVFVNASRYGGCGGAVGVSSLNSSSDEIQIHEFGHSFAGLADEYDYGSTSTNCTPSATRNIDCPDRFPLVKWQIWVNAGTPIPTPPMSPYLNVVGAFEGAGYQVKGIYRPMFDCKMRSLGVALCPICKEAHILRLFQQFRMLDASDPPLGEADVPTYGTRTFRAIPINVAGLRFQWYTNGTAVAGAMGNTYTIAGSSVVSTNFELRLDIVHTTTLVRAEAIINTNRWTLRTAPEPFVSALDASVFEAETNDTTLAFPVVLSFPHTNNVLVQYTTVDATATAPGDYAPTNGLLTFAPGQTTNFVYVTVHGDTAAEADEVLFLRLSSPTNATLHRAQGVGLIRDRDHPPVVKLTTPKPDDAFGNGANVPLVAEAFDIDGTVARVRFYSGATLVGQAQQEPFSATWSNAAPGAYILTAVATDNSGRMATSAPVSIGVLSGVVERFTLIPLDGDWKYDASTNDFGNAWKSPTYNDISWAGPSPALLQNESDSIPGPFGTSLPLTYNNARIRTFYFRTHFNFPSAPGPGLLLTASNLIDDGAVFWLNGAEVGRLRMAAGTPTRTTLASASPPGSDATNFEVLSFSTANLLVGDNVMAVEVHQQSDTSSDVVFGMTLESLRGLAPVLIDPNQPTNRTVRQGRSTTLSVTAAATPAPNYQWYRNNLLIGNATNSSYTIALMTAPQAGNYFVRVSNIVGVITSRTAVVTYEADTAPPQLIYAVASTNLTRVTVTFSEPMNSTDARTPGNYVLDFAGGPPVNISTVVQAGTNFVLVTDPLQAGVQYRVVANNVRDSSGNVIAPAPPIPVANEVVLLGGDRTVWRYFQSNRAPGPGWAVSGYEDSTGWESGPALFDAKSPSPRPTVGPNNEPVRTQLRLINPAEASDQTLSYYFRATFPFPGTTAGAKLRLRTLVDDGAVFYLNGQEVFRLRLPEAPMPIDYSTLASVTQNDPQNVYEGPFELPVAALRQGENVFAVEVHQADVDSSDISFSAQLIGEVPPPGAGSLVLRIAPVPGGYQLSWDDPAAQLEGTASLGGSWTPETPTGDRQFLVPTGSATRFFRLHRQ